jgi:hypothetical protein
LPIVIQVMPDRLSFVMASSGWSRAACSGVLGRICQGTMPPPESRVLSDRE